MKDPFWAIFINLINGPAYVFFANSAVNYANKMAPPSLAATSQGLLNSTISLAGVVSSILMGVLFDQVGPSGMFTAMAFCCLAALLVFGLGMLRNRSMQRADAQTAPPTD
jgi:sugar phosphate permease